MFKSVDIWFLQGSINHPAKYDLSFCKISMSNRAAKMFITWEIQMPSGLKEILLGPFTTTPCVFQGVTGFQVKV